MEEKKQDQLMKQTEQTERTERTEWTTANGSDLSEMTCETLLVSNMELSKNRDFNAEAILVRSEFMEDSDGHDKVFLIEKGSLFIPAKEFDEALESADLKCSGNDLLDCRSSEFRRIAMDSKQGLSLLCIAANEYFGIETIYSTVVQIGLPVPDDSSKHHVFDKTPIFYPAETSLWAILRNLYPDFNDTPEENPKEAISYNYDCRGSFTTSPFEGLSREIRTRADLVNIHGFSRLERDTAGNPKVYKHEYEHADCDEAPENLDKYDAPAWSVLSACETGNPEACPECGHEISPRESGWIGPKEEELIAMWKNFPALEESEPGPEPGI